MLLVTLTSATLITDLLQSNQKMQNLSLKQELKFLSLFLRPDDNSNQSSIADSSPVKQENSCSTSPTPETTAVSHRENSEAKTDQSPDSKRGEPLQQQTSDPVKCTSRLFLKMDDVIVVSLSGFANTYSEALMSPTSFCPFHPQ